MWDTETALLPFRGEGAIVPAATTAKRLVAAAVLLLGASACEEPSPSQDSSLILSTGARVGVYHQVGEGLRRTAAADGALPKIALSPSEGSGANLGRLREGLADWAIIQRDVAVEAHFGQDAPFRDLRVLMPLFPEAVQILVRPGEEQGDGSGPEDGGLEVLVEDLRDGRIRRIAVGPPGSGSNRTLKNVLSLYGVPRDADFYREVPYDSAYRAFDAGEVDALGVVIAFPFETFEGFGEGLRMVSMSREDVDRITDHLRDLESVRVPAGSYPFLENDVRTVGTWALLVGRERPGRQLVGTGGGEALVRSVVRAARSDGEGGLRPVGHAFGPAGAFRVDSSGERWRLRTAPAVDRSAFFRGLPVHADLRDMLPDRGVTPWWWLALVGLVLVALFTVHHLRGPHEHLHEHLEREDLEVYWVRYKHYLYGLAVLAAVYAIIPHLVLHFERAFGAAHRLTSPFQNLSVAEVRRWLLVLSVTGYSEGLFPISTWGKIAATATMPLTWAGLGLAVVAEFVFIQRRKRRRSGMEPVDFEGHVVVCGWNDRVPHLIRKTVAAGEEFLGDHRGRGVVVLDERFKPSLEASRELKKLHDREDLEFVAGDAKNREHLEMANVAQAGTIILVAEDRSRDADERTLLRALTISRHCREVADQPTLDNIYIVAEVNDPELRGSLLEADVNEVVCGPDFTENVLVQATYNHGLSEILDELLSYNAANEFYLIEAERYDLLVGKTFDEALRELREYGILLTGIKVVFRENGRDLIDRDRIGQRLNEMGLERQIITNPVYDGEMSYRIREDDEVFVLARDEASIDEALA